MPPAKPKVVSLSRLRSERQVRIEAWVRLADTVVGMMRRVEQLLAGHGITLPQFDVLANLALRDGLTQQQLAARLQVTKGNVCGLIDRLEKLGWVVRRPDEHDGRTNRLSITPAGRATVDAVRPAHDALVLDLFKPLTADDVAGLSRVLATLSESNQS